MKIEIGESLMYSWLRHIKECQIVQTNWKPSSQWEITNSELLENIHATSAEYFKNNFAYDLFKGNSGLTQIIAQGEIDALGIHFSGNDIKIYAIDIAFHENGLNYGSKEETVTRVMKKCIRTIMSILAYYGNREIEVIFASPKIHNAIYALFQEVIPHLNKILAPFSIMCNIRIICNDEFSNNILEPIIEISGNVADTSELFMRSLQLYKLSAKQAAPKANISPQIKRSIVPKADINVQNFTESNTSPLCEMKVGAIARTVLSKLLEENKIDVDTINQMQTLEYSKSIFLLNFPLLVLAEKSHFRKPNRYYANPLTIHGKKYFLSSEWFEKSKPYLILWLDKYMH